MNNEKSTNQLNIVFFDGYCNLCSALVSFLLKADKKGILYFSPIQSDFATIFLKKNNLSKDSVTLLSREKIYTKSTAVLKILVNLGLLWKLFYVFFIIPRFVRDYVYEFISKNRFRWFGERSTCYKPHDKFYNKFIYR